MPKKYINGEYVELTEAEVAELEKAANRHEKEKKRATTYHRGKNECFGECFS